MQNQAARGESKQRMIKLYEALFSEASTQDTLESAPAAASVPEPQVGDLEPEPDDVLYPEDDEIDPLADET
eukprot:7702880-Pyramimonas_sp.AAC.1